MSNPFLMDDADDYTMFQEAMRRRAGGVTRRFDEYYRCYPVAMLPGPDREGINHGGKVFLPASALEKLTRLHIAYPMLFELINGRQGKTTHAGVLEFIAEEGKIYLPYWLMQTLLLEPGDLIQVKSTDLPPGTFIKLQAQSTDFLEISDPKAVLENAFRNFSCLTVGDVFSFEYNDSVYEVAVLEVKPDNGSHAIYTMETDLSVDFAPPKGYEELEKANAAAFAAAKANGGSGPGSRTPSVSGADTRGTMAQSINYSAIAPADSATSSRRPSTQFQTEGHRLGSSKRSKTSTPATASTPVAGASTNVPPAALNIPPPRSSTNPDAPKPLRLPPGKLFFGYPYKPPPAKKEAGEGEGSANTRFQGMGQTLRGRKVESAAGKPAVSAAAPAAAVSGAGSSSVAGQRLGRTPKDVPPKS